MEKWCAFGVLLPKVLLREKSGASTCHLVRPHLSGPWQSLQWCYIMGFQSIPCLTSYILTHISSVIVSQGKTPYYWGWPITSSRFSFCLLSESILPQNLWGSLIELEPPIQSSTLFLEKSPLRLLASLSLDIGPSPLVLQVWGFSNGAAGSHNQKVLELFCSSFHFHTSTLLSLS